LVPKTQAAAMLHSGLIFSSHLAIRLARKCDRGLIAATKPDSRVYAWRNFFGAGVVPYLKYRSSFTLFVFILSILTVQSRQEPAE
jgi:hypothetical protein